MLFLSNIGWPVSAQIGFSFHLHNKVTNEGWCTDCTLDTISWNEKSFSLLCLCGCCCCCCCCCCCRNAEKSVVSKIVRSKEYSSLERRLCSTQSKNKTTINGTFDCTIKHTSNGTLDCTIEHRSIDTFDCTIDMHLTVHLTVQLNKHNDSFDDLFDYSYDCTFDNNVAINLTLEVGVFSSESEYECPILNN